MNRNTIETESPSSSSSTGINLQDNARIKVSTWLTGLVEEVRKKSQGSVQKWVDTKITTTISTPIEIVTQQESKVNDNHNVTQLPIKSQILIKVTEADTSIDCDLNEISNETSINLNCDQQQNIVVSCKSDEIKETVTTVPEIIKNSTSDKIWSKETLFTKFSNSIDKTKTASQFSVFGKAKINEFYDRVRMNKIKYNNLMKSRRMNTSSTSPTTTTAAVTPAASSTHAQSIKAAPLTSSSSSLPARNFCTDADDNTTEDNYGSNEKFNYFKKSSKEIKTYDDDDGEDDDEDENINLTIESDNFPSSSFSHNLNLDDNNSHNETHSSDNKTGDNRNLRRKSDVIQNSPSKTMNLSYIGRSYSEVNDGGDDGEDDDDLYLLNERSQSCSHSINNENIIMSPMMIINNNNNNNNNTNNSNNNVSHSLPSFLESKLPSSSLSSAAINPLLNLQKMKKAKTTLSMPTSTAIGIATGTDDKSSSESPKRNVLLRDSSIQSDSSHCSSVESLLESRRPDPEAILINLGFGPIESEDILSRIPKRFLKPSQVRGIDTEAFLRRQQLANHLHDHSVLGYRGLVDPEKLTILQRFKPHKPN